MKKQRPDWFPRSRAKQLIMFTNVKAKIEGYKSILPLPQEKIDRIVLICDIFIGVCNFVEQSRAKMKNLTDWQDLLFTGEGGTVGDVAPAAPVFQTFTLPTGAFVGIFEEFRELREDIVGADNYTEGIGEDLMIVGDESEDLNLADVVANIEPQALRGMKKVRITGSMQGFKGMQVQYQREGAADVQTFYLTNLPADITIQTAVAGQPENGVIRAVMYEDNQPVGQWSPDFPVTIS
jgi:hypothetical protein